MNNYDPSQPRIPKGDPRGGQWTSEQVQTATDAARKAAGLQSERELAIQIGESELAGLDYERLLVFNDRGDIINRIDGGETGIYIDNDTPEGQKLFEDMKGGITSHNHPYSDLPFSWRDMETAGIQHEKETRVYGKTVTHVLRPGKYSTVNKRGGGIWFGEGEKSILHIKDTFNSIMTMVVALHGLKTEHFMFSELEESDQVHIAWEGQELLARFYGWEYERITHG